MDAIRNELLDELLKGVKEPKDLSGRGGILDQLTKGLIERMLEGEMTEHLGYEKHDNAGDNSGNSRNGSSRKSLKTKTGEIEIRVPRDRNGDFEPQIVEKRQTRFEGFDEQILSMYARGMTTREIIGHLQDMYQTELSPQFISTVTDSVLDGLREWQDRSLEGSYPIVWFDAIRLKIRDEGHIVNKAVYLALAVDWQGRKELLGMWIEQTEGAKFWLAVFTELHTRGVQDILVASVDGLKGFPDAIRSVFPRTEVQTCVVHMIRNSLAYVTYKDRKEVAGDLRPVYTAATAEAGLSALGDFEAKWAKKYSIIVRGWRANWPTLSTFFPYSLELRKIMYTTNAIESLNMSLRKITKNRASFPNDEAAMKLLFMALRNISRKWRVAVMNWPAAVNQLAIIFGDRVPA
jgi:putative transposase